MKEKKEMEAIFDSEKKKALGDLAESMVKAGVKKAIIDYDDAINRLNQVDAAGVVEIHCHAPLCSINFGKVSDIPTGIPESCHDFVLDHSSSKFVLSIFPKEEKEINNIYGRLRKHHRSCCIGEKSQYMIPDVFVKDFMPYYNKQVTVCLQEIKDQIRKTYNERVNEFSSKVLDVLHGIFSESDEVIVNNIKIQLDYFKNMSVDAYLSKLNVDLEADFPADIIPDPNLREFFIKERQAYLISGVNDFCYSISERLWESILAYLITINNQNVSSTLPVNHSKSALRNRCDAAEKNNVAQFPFITEAISYTRSAINEFDVSDANDILVDALSLLYRSIRDLELPNEDKSRTRDKNPRIDAGFKLLKLPKDVPSWLTIDLLLDC